ncbi:hypothetical protein D9M71_246480 [compost metagenome]
MGCSYSHFHRHGDRHGQVARLSRGPRLARGDCAGVEFAADPEFGQPLACRHSPGHRHELPDRLVAYHLAGGVHGPGGADGSAHRGCTGRAPRYCPGPGADLPGEPGAGAARAERDVAGDGTAGWGRRGVDPGVATSGDQTPVPGARTIGHGRLLGILDGRWRPGGVVEPTGGRAFPALANRPGNLAGAGVAGLGVMAMDGGQAPVGRHPATPRGLLPATPGLAAGLVFRPDQRWLHQHGRLAARLLPATGLEPDAQRFVVGVHDHFPGAGGIADARACPAPGGSAAVADDQPAGAGAGLLRVGLAARPLHLCLGSVDRLRPGRLLCPEPDSHPGPPQGPAPGRATGRVRAGHRLFDQCHLTLDQRLAA